MARSDWLAAVGRHVDNEIVVRCELPTSSKFAILATELCFSETSMHWLCESAKLVFECLSTRTTSYG